MKTADYVALEERYNAHNYLPLDVVLTRGEGVWVWDVEAAATWIASRPTRR